MIVYGTYDKRVKIGLGVSVWSVEDFLFVLTAYAAQQQAIRDHFKQLARRDFREHIIKALRNYFKVYQVCLRVSENLDVFVKRNYYQLAGRVFSFNNILLYAEENLEQSLNIPDDAFSMVYKRNIQLILKLNHEEVELEEITLGGPVVKKYSSDKEPDKSDADGNKILDWPIVTNIEEAACFTTHLPVYSVRAACGAFNHRDTDEQEGWLSVIEYGIKPKVGMFIVHAEGDSMEPKISDGDLCVFTNSNLSGSRNGIIVLVESNKYDCRHAIKQYFSSKEYSEDGWFHDFITLHSLNPNYHDIVLSEEDEPRIAGIFVEVLHRSIDNNN